MWSTLHFLVLSIISQNYYTSERIRYSRFFHRRILLILSIHNGELGPLIQLVTHLLIMFWLLPLALEIMHPTIIDLN